MRAQLYFFLVTALAPITAQVLRASQSPVLVVYAENDPASVDVAKSYAEKRSIPDENLCPVTLPNVAATAVGPADYDGALKQPIRACLEAVGKRKILYIVLAYMRPYAVDPGGGLHDYSLDSYLADIWDEQTDKDADPVPLSEHAYFAGNQAQGNFYRPFVSLTEFRKDEKNPLLYSVWRLDGPTAAIAKNLAENAIYAESHGLAGQACIDAIVEAPYFADSGLRAGDWELYRAADFLRQAGLAVTLDMNGEEFGNSPAPAKCSDAALYSGWYSYNTYYDAFTWNPGSIGFHLDSASAMDPRGGNNWSANALQRGITVTSGAISEPYLEGLAKPSGLFRNLLEGATVGEAFLRNTAWIKWRVINIGDPLYRPYPYAVAPFNAPRNENGMFVQARDAVSGDAFEGAVLIDQPAPAGGLTVKLTSDNAALQIPGSVNIPEGALYGMFSIAAGLVPTPVVTQVTGETGSATVRNSIAIYPVLDAVRTAASSVKGGESLQGTVRLNRPAPEGGYTISLSVAASAPVQIPGSVTVPKGAQSVRFTIATSAVSAKTDVKISASFQGATVETTFSVTP